MEDENRPCERALKRDFRVFLYVVWKLIGLPPPTPVQYDIAQYLQNGPRRKVVMAFRGVGKTGVYAAFALWRLYRDPERKILIVSASKSLADAIAQFVKRLMTSTPLFDHLRPRRGQRDGASVFDVGPAQPSKDPSLKAVGITGQITGSRADDILADDVESAGNALTEAARRKLGEQVRELDAVIKPGGTVTFLGTPQTERSLYLELFERGYDGRVWPAEVPERADVYAERLAPFVLRKIEAGEPVGAPIDPLRFDGDDLAERAKSFGPTGYALQFLLDPRAAGGDQRPLKLSDLLAAPLEADQAPNMLTWSDAPEHVAGALPQLGVGDDQFRRPAAVSADRAPYAGAVMAIDPSGRGADETAYAVVKQLNARLFLTAAGGLEGGYAAETLAALTRIAKEQRVNRIVIEANFGDGMFTRLLAPELAREKVAAALEETRGGGQKERRILGVLEPIFAQHRLVVSDEVILRDAEDAACAAEKSLFFQITRLSPRRGALAHDDRVDALAMAAAAWSAALGRDLDAAAEAQRAKRLRQDVKALTRKRKPAPAPKRGRRWG